MEIKECTSGRPILLVEDDPDHEVLMIRALRRNNVPDEVIVARDGAEALDYLFARGDHAAAEPQLPPRVIILDLQLPRIGGLEVLRQMRADQRTKLLPVVVLTSSDEEQDLVASYHLGANSYVRKPVDFNRFMDVTRQLGRYWLFLNQTPPPIER